MSASLVLAVWVGSLYLRPFGRCGKCNATGHIKSGKRRVKVCPRCKGRRRVQRVGLPHRPPGRRKIRDGQRAAVIYQEDSHGDT